MPHLRYERFCNLSDQKAVSAVDFSPCGKMLAAVTFDGQIAVWDTYSGKKFYPELSLVHCLPLVIQWIDVSCFVVGLSDGSLASFSMFHLGGKSKVSLFIFKDSLFNKP
jgi:WD40 repeat protein